MHEHDHAENKRSFVFQSEYTETFKVVTNGWPAHVASVASCTHLSSLCIYTLLNSITSDSTDDYAHALRQLQVAVRLCWLLRKFASVEPMYCSVHVQSQTGC